MAAVDPVLDMGTRAGLAAAVRAEARRQNVPPDLADAVATIETNYSPYLTGGSGEVGLMQILPSTAASLGYMGETIDLFTPATNIRYGVAYLARAWAGSGGNLCVALTKYRAGLAQQLFTPLSQQYCARGTAYLASIGSSLAQTGIIDGAYDGVRLPSVADSMAVALTRPAGGPPAPAANGAASDAAVVATIWQSPAGRRAAALWHSPPTGYHYHRSEAERMAALDARFESHRRPLYNRP